MWRWVGTERPPFAVVPQPGQVSVWDYPRPPGCEVDTRPVFVTSAEGTTLARAPSTLRIFETASPPTFYISPEHIDWRELEAAPGSSHCEWKGEARYWRLRNGSEPVAWSYPQPQPGFEALRDWIAFYPNRVACFVDAQRVVPQPGHFYGGWITPELVGPFKGEPGSQGW